MKKEVRSLMNFFVMILSAMVMSGCGAGSKSVADDKQVFSENTSAEMKEIYRGYDKEYGTFGNFDTMVTLGDEEYHVTSKALDFVDEFQSVTYEITVNDKTVTYKSDLYWLAEAYLAKLDKDDDSVYLFVSPVSENSYQTMSAYKYSPAGIEQLEFDYSADGDAESILDPGHTCSNFKLSEDGVFSLITGNHSKGMWGVQRYFTLDKNDVFVFEQADKYEIIGWADGKNMLKTYDSKSSEPRIMTYEEAKLNPMYCIESEKDYEMLLEGYYSCKQSYGDLKAGDYFRLVYDACDGNVMFVTSDGREGWINVNELSSDTTERGQVGGFALMLAC